MKRNEHPDFAGIEQVKQKQAGQLAQFESWAATGDWQEFHGNHYDWWMFPYDEPSSKGFRWVVYETEVAELNQDPAYVKNYLRGVELLLLSWGWLLHEQRFVDHPGKNQTWANWPIRLYKCGRSLKQFGFQNEFDSIRKYARLLLDKKTDFRFNGRDLYYLFR